MKNRNIWFAFFIGIVLAVVVAFLLWPDREHDTHATEHSQIMANDDSVRSHKAQFLFIIDSLNKDKRQLIEENKSLKEGQAATRKQLDLKTAEARDLAKEVQRRNKDTALQAVIDSLVSKMENYAFLLTQYEQYSDSINAVNDNLKINYEAADKEKDKRITELQTAYDSLFKAYQQLFADSRVMAKDLKKQKLKTKIAAVLGGAAAILGLIK